MKRFLFTTVLIAATLGVLLYFAPRSMSSDVLSYVRYDPTVNVYCRNTTADSVDLGLGRQVTCMLCDYQQTLAECNGVDGVSVTFCGSLDDVTAVVARLRAKEVSRQQLDGLTIVCYYSPLIRERALIDGKIVNVQAAYCNGTVTVGYPLILGAY